MKNDPIVSLVNQLLLAEKKYFETADIVKVVSLKRLLNSQSTQRNAMVQSILLLDSCDHINFTNTYIEKELLYTNGKGIALVLENSDFLSKTKACLAIDNQCINACDEVLDLADLSLDIMEKVLDIKMDLLLNTININKQLTFLKKSEVNKNENSVKYLNFG